MRIVFSSRIPSLMSAQRNSKTKAMDKHSDSWRSYDILLQLNEQSFVMHLRNRNTYGVYNEL